MPSKTAKPAQPVPRSVVLVLFRRTKLLDVAGPVQVFNDARLPDGAPAYRITLASDEGSPILTDTGIALATERLDALDANAIDTLLISGGSAVFSALRSPLLRTWLAAHAGAPRRLGSVCLGAFVLADLDLLDGLEATTHWEACDRLARDYPAVTVLADAIYVAAGRVWTSAGVTAGIDMALAMVERDLGHAAALALARDLVLFLKRPGGQSQFSVELRRQTSDARGRFDMLHQWMRANLDQDMSVPALAEAAAMSLRNFARVYRRETGLSPARAVEQFRAEAARRLLESTPLSMQQIARCTGFGDDERLRRAFVKAYGVSPHGYRGRFGQQLR